MSRQSLGGSFCHTHNQRNKPLASQIGEEWVKGVEYAYRPFMISKLNPVHVLYTVMKQSSGKTCLSPCVDTHAIHSVGCSTTVLPGSPNLPTSSELSCFDIAKVIRSFHFVQLWLVGRQAIPSHQIQVLVLTYWKDLIRLRDPRVLTRGFSDSQPGTAETWSQ